MSSRIKNTLLLLVIVLSFSCSNRKYTMASLTNVKGPLKTMVRKRHMVKGEGTKVFSFKEVFDKSGKVLNYTTKGEVNNTEVINTTLTLKYEGDKFVGWTTKDSKTTVLNYNEKGLWTTLQMITDTDTTMTSVVWNNFKLQSSTSKKNGVLSMEESYTYNEKGDQKTLQYKYKQSEEEQIKLVTSEVYEYVSFDKKGNWTKRKVVDQVSKEEYIETRELEFF